MMSTRRTELLVVAALLMTACNSNTAIPQPPQAVQVAHVNGSSTSESSVRFSGVLMPDSQLPLSFRTPGYVISLLRVRTAEGSWRDVGEGDHVRRGEILANLRPSEYKEKVQQAGSQAEAAQAAALKAKSDFDRASRLYESQSITKPEFDAARAQYDATQAQLRAAQAATGEARIALSDSMLRSPMQGDIVKKLVEVGSFVGPGTPAFVLANTDIVKITVGVPDVTVQTLKLGVPVSISTDVFPDRVFESHVSRIAAAADPKSRNFDVEISIPNHDHVLKAGMIASVEFATENKQAVAPTIPIPAIVQSPGGGYAVFVIERDKATTIARLRPVEVGNVRGNEIEVVKGLSTGDRIVSTGASMVKDGQTVEVVK
jgi:multidrug efflux system membrane fusion protein